jgi:hypothetical protein
MPDDVQRKDNIERLLERLKDGSLAARLVRAHAAKNAQGRAASMKAVLTECLEEAKAKLDAAAD